MFTDYEIAYLKSQPLARLATVSITGRPDVAPVGFEFDGEYFFIGGHNPTNTRKYKNVRNGNSASTPGKPVTNRTVHSAGVQDRTITK